MEILKRIFQVNCEHDRVRTIERRTWEHRCDCCHKVLFNKEEHDFNITTTDKKLLIEN
jgi:hypothetical protein